MEQIVKVDDVWERIRPELAEIKRKTNADWSLSQVHYLCLTGQWIVFADNDCWLMLRMFVNEFTCKTTMEITAGYHKGEDPDAIFDDHLPFIKFIAAAMKAEIIEIRSPRKGWVKKGFKPVDIIYRMEVQDVTLPDHV